MNRAYATLSISENNDIINFSKFTFIAQFTTNRGRKINTNRLNFNVQGQGIEVYIDLNQYENASNTTVMFTIYLPLGREYKKVYGHIYTKLGNSSKIVTTYDLKIFQDLSKPIQGYVAGRRVIPQNFPIPDGLRMVAYLRNEIKKASQKYGIETQIIASIVFQEKYHGVWAYRKNLVSYYLSLGVLNPKNSYGFPEMQLVLASELLNNKDNPNWIEETFLILCADATLSMELIAKNTIRGQRIFSKKFSVHEATIFHNAGELGTRSYISGKISQSTLVKAVYYRSWRWQKAIEVALYGDIIAIPDDCSGACRADPETNIETWKFDPSLRSLSL